MATLIDSEAFVFADGNSGHVCNLGTAPDEGDWDILCVNSNTVVSTPSGFTAAEAAVTNQGAYLFVREAAGSEGATVTVTTSGDHNTFVGWSRWSGLGAVDTTTSTQVNGGAGNTTPAHSTGTLAETDELVIAFGALHSIGGTPQTSPTWSTGYTGLLDDTQGTGATGVRGYVAYKTGAGTAAETPQVTWSGAGVQNAYMLAVTFTTVDEAPPEVEPVKATSTAAVSARRTSTASVGAGAGAWTASIATGGTEQWVRYPATTNYPSESLYPSAG